MPPAAPQPPHQHSTRRKLAHEALPAMPHAPATSPGTSPLTPALVLRTVDASRYVGLAASSLEKMRLDGSGPIFVRLSARAVGYLIADLDKYLEQRRRLSTSAPAQQVGSRARGSNKDAGRTRR
jgi:hypothetical protein